MPIEIRRFGVGHRRPDGPAGTSGVTGQVIHSDARGTVSELAFGRDGRLEPHTNPNTTWFIVIEGGGWVVVDHERLRVAAGEAVLWPASVPHGAWADHGPMRVFVVELTGADDSWVRGLIDAPAVVRAIGAGGPAERGEGHLAGPRPAPAPDPEAGEPA
jgi:quercetin dioxygenase-like cupin family protein